MAKPSKLKVGDVELEISPDMSPEQIKAMITSVATLTNKTQNLEQNDDLDFLIEQEIKPDPFMIMTRGTWVEKIALFIRNEFGELEFTANDVQMQFHAIFQKILDKSAITTYLNRLVSKGYLVKNKLPGNRVYKFKSTNKLLLEYPEVVLEEFNSISNSEKSHSFRKVGV